MRKLRIAVLALVLAFVAASAWLARVRSTDWDSSLWVVVYPIDGDGQPRTARHIAALTVETFDPVEEFLRREGRRYGLAVSRPVEMSLGPVVAARPPPPPRGGGAFAAIRWSLGFRLWASRHDDFDGPRPDVRLFVLYHDPDGSPSLAHSLGLREGLIGVVNAFASRRMTATNNVVIAHEILHTVGATDKYDPATNLPRFPEGYADPDADPRLPQRGTEIMAGRRAVSETEAETPRSLSGVVVGPATAREINWIR